MRMAIEEIILWPKRETDQPRRIPFKTDRVNVITGDSRTGKSSLLHIVDYCLGSAKCSIPVGKIRDLTAWFAILVRFEASRALIGRATPEHREQSGDVFVVDPEKIDIASHRPVKTANLSYLKEFLNQQALLPDLPINPHSDSGFDNRASFRDMAAFNFQPQHIVANPNSIFFKADTYEHREKLRNVFPICLGALTPKQLLAKFELRRVEAELQAAEQKLARYEHAAEQMTGELRSYYIRGRELGLLPGSPPPPIDWAAEDYLRFLRTIPERSREMQPLAVDPGAAAASVEILRRLDDAERETARVIATRKKALYQTERLGSSIQSYGTELAGQRGRMIGIGWLAGRIAERPGCVLCGAENAAALAEAERLQTLANELAERTANTSTSTPALEREIGRLKTELRDAEERLNRIRAERWVLEDQTEQLAEQRQTLREVYRFAGRIEQALETYWTARGESDAVADVERLHSEVESLRRTANSGREKKLIQAKLKGISASAAIYADRLQLERANDLIEVDVNDLMLYVTSIEGRKDALWEIGSGANWVGYHLSCLLALHEVFRSVDGCPVPTFLMIDQPSQAYFPEKWPGDMPSVPSAPIESAIESRSADIAAVRKIFETLSFAAERSAWQLQVIVVDHAGPITWQGLEGVHQVANWRPGADQYLIPDEWQT